MDTNLRLILEYPLINCTEETNCTKYSGIITFNQYQDTNFAVAQHKNGVFEVTTVFEPEIARKLAEIRANEITHFLDASKKILSTYFTEKTITNHSKIYKRVLHEYTEFTRFQINVKTCKISPDLTEIRITTQDDASRTHSLLIAVDYTASCDLFKAIDVDLPEIHAKKLETPTAHLSDLFHRFAAMVDQLQALYGVFDELDQCSSVLDPAPPCRKLCHRRIWLADNLSLVVSIDPVYAHAPPDVKFLGPERQTRPLYAKLNANLPDWDETGNFVANLLQLIGFSGFPRQPKPQNELGDPLECSICFLARFNGSLPEVICENKCCENYFHVECIYEWLVTLNSKRVFDRIYGVCPNCEKSISCPVP